MRRRRMNQLFDKRAIVTGASRGLGRGVMEAFLAEGAAVVAVARDTGPLAELAARDPRLQLVAADASDPVVAARLLGQYSPAVLGLVAGAAPVLRPLQQHTWESFSTNWSTDVRMTFHWLREALLLPLRPGSRIIVMSSGAAIMGSPLSGGEAGGQTPPRLLAGPASPEEQRGHPPTPLPAQRPTPTPATEL